MEILIRIEVRPDDKNLPKLWLTAHHSESESFHTEIYKGERTLDELISFLPPAKEKKVEVILHREHDTVRGKLDVPTDPRNVRQRVDDIVEMVLTKDQIQKNDFVRVINALEREDGYQVQVGKEYRVLGVLKQGEKIAGFDISDDANPARISVAAEEVVFARREEPVKRGPEVFEHTYSCPTCKEITILKLVGMFYFGHCPKCSEDFRIDRAQFQVKEPAK